MVEKELFTPKQKEDKLLLTAFGWWEKKRIIYNIVVGCAGVFILFTNGGEFTIPNFIGIIIYGLLANLFYSLGFLIEIGAKHYFKSDRDFGKIREGLFWAGLILSVIITIFLGSISTFPAQH